LQTKSRGGQGSGAVNRRSVLTGGAALGAVGALAAIWRQSQRLANAQGDMRIDLLNLGLQSEYLTCTAYEEAIEYAEGMFDARDLEFVHAMRDECEASVETFRAAVEEFGGTPIEPTGMTYPEEAEESREVCLKLLLEIEDVTMRAWHGAAPAVQDPSVVVLAQQLGLTKARRAGALGFLLGEAAPPFPAPMVTGMPLAEALEQLEPYRGAPE
jgi:ferritin-like protein